MPTAQVRTLLVVGGVPVKEQINALSAGVDVVCGTPGRLEELINTGQLALQNCRFFVLDEADGLLKAVRVLYSHAGTNLYVYILLQ